MITDSDINKFLDQYDLKCARCNKPLDYIRTSIGTNAFDWDVHVSFRCHGAEDNRTAALSRLDLVSTSGVCNKLLDMLALQPFEQARLAEAGGLF